MRTAITGLGVLTLVFASLAVVQPSAEATTRITSYNVCYTKLLRVKTEFDVPHIPNAPMPEKLSGTKQILEEKGPEGVVEWIKNQNKLLLTDTTMRDAHQSLMA